MTLDPALFAPGPARDERFDVRECWAELDNEPEPAGESALSNEFLHRQMHEEVSGLEIAARNLTDFPDAPWELRLAIARQCWDETRHVVAFRRLYEARGGVVGAHPVLDFEYRILTRIDTLAGRLAVQNRSFEAAGLDAIEEMLGRLRASGAEPEMADLLDTQLTDEMQHVRYANDWLARLAAEGGPRVTFAMAKAVAQAAAAFAVVAGGATVTYPIAAEARRDAGFREDEIAAARAAAEAR